MNHVPAGIRPGGTAGSWRMTMENIITITVELSDEQAQAYAQFLKRTCFNDYAANAVDKDEAYTMVDAGEKIRKALAEAGYAPR
jgi:hypothetical protein